MRARFGSTVRPRRRFAAVVTPPAHTTVSASLTRYDGQSGTALFRGTIPFAPGVMPDVQALSTVRVLVAGSEPAGGVWIEPLMGTHSDGSLKVAYVEFEATCGSAETVACTVELGATRTVPDRGAVVDAVERTPLAWVRNPTLFFVTDADYRVAARMAPLPLITMAQAQARLPASWVTALTTGIASKWPAVGGTASYNINYAILCLADMTGNPAYVQSALAPFVPVTAGGSGHLLDYYTPNEGRYTPELRLNNNPSSNQYGLPAEWYNAAPTMLLGYWHTGAKQLEVCLELTGAAGRPVQYSSAYGVRFNLRGYFSNYIVGKLINQSRTIVSLAGGWSYNPNAMTTTAAINGFITAWEGGVNTITTSQTLPAWAKGYTLWGLSASSWTGNEHPLFQIATSIWQLMVAYLHFGQDSRIPAALDSMRAFLDTQLKEHTITDGGGHTAYRHSYFPMDPAVLATDTGVSGSSAVYFFLSTIFTPMYAFAYARNTADSDAALRADRLVDVKMYNRDVTSGGGGFINTQKGVGEWFFMTPHAAAWRAGVPWNGWTLPD